MTRETIKEYILQVKSQDGTEALYNRWEPDILVEVINEIFNDREAQVQAKDDEIRRLNNLYADTIKDLGEVLMEIERLKEQIKANDELIEVLECRAYHAEGYIKDLHSNSKEQQ